MSQTQKTEKHTFQAEVSKLLNIVTHALYSDKQIFLRELMSNASDACDRLRYEGLTDESLLKNLKSQLLLIQIKKLFENSVISLALRRHGRR